MGKKGRSGYNRHHIRPKSRNGGSESRNISMQKIFEHRVYHKEFSNRTPDEIITYLVEEWWNGQWEWVEKALRRKSEN
jgi:hypothetical protein